MRTQSSDQLPALLLTALDDLSESRRAKIERLKEAVSRQAMRIDARHIASRILESGDLTR